MSWKFKIEETWLDHCEGTKFYHLFRISEAAGGRAITALHFGGYRGDTTAFRRPVKGGQVQFKPDRQTYVRQMASKLTPSGGYIKNHSERLFEFHSKAALHSALLAQFGKADTDEILVKLGLSTDPNDDDEWEADENYLESHPSDTGEDTSIEKFENRPAAWGTW